MMKSVNGEGVNVSSVETKKLNEVHPDFTIENFYEDFIRRAISYLDEGFL